jgi:hypothetical protein
VLDGILEVAELLRDQSEEVVGERKRRFDFEALLAFRDDLFVPPSVIGGVSINTVEYCRQRIEFEGPANLARCRVELSEPGEYLSVDLAGSRVVGVELDRPLLLSLAPDSKSRS